MGQLLSHRGVPQRATVQPNFRSIFAFARLVSDKRRLSLTPPPPPARFRPLRAPKTPLER